MKIIALLLLIAFVVFGIFGVAVWALFKYTNFYIGMLLTYILSVLVATGIFTGLVYNGDVEDKKDDEKDIIPDLPFMPKKDD